MLWLLKRTVSMSYIGWIRKYSQVYAIKKSVYIDPCSQLYLTLYVQYWSNLANSEGPDEMLQNVTFHQGLHF